MLDRIGIHIEVPRFDFEKLSDNRRGESSEIIRARVEKAHQMQRERFADLNNGMMTNADMRVAEVRQFSKMAKIPSSESVFIPHCVKCNVKTDHFS